MRKGPTVTRRAFLGGALGGVAGTALPLPAHARSTRRVGRRADVAIVGAGLAGLTAARELTRAGVGVVVLEARNRVGGRTLSVDIGHGAIVDLGGQWIGPLPDQGSPNPQARMFELARRLRVATFKTYDQGDYLDYSNGQLVRYSERIPPNAGTANAGFALERLDMMAADVPPRAPWEAPEAGNWDAKSFETWMREELTPPDQPPDAATNALVTLAIQAVFAAEPRDLSLLHVLFYIRAAGSLDNLVNTTAGAQDTRFVRGSQQVSIRMARALEDRVVLGSPVRRIAQGANGVRVESERLTVGAERVVVAIPPWLAGAIEYDPPLSDFDGGTRGQLTQRLPMGTTIKVQCVYPEPFWRDEGLAGQVTSDTGPVRITFDNSPRGGKPGILLGFIEGHEGRVWGARSRARRRRAVLESMARYFGPRAGRPIDYAERVWAAEPFTGGCYGAFFPTGVWTSLGRALRDPIRLIHWAGTETATDWMGYMEGAVESGQRVAREVLAALGS